MNILGPYVVSIYNALVKRSGGGNLLWVWAAGLHSQRSCGVVTCEAGEVLRPPAGVWYIYIYITTTTHSCTRLQRDNSNRHYHIPPSKNRYYSRPMRSVISTLITLQHLRMGVQWLRCWRLGAAVRPLCGGVLHTRLIQEVNIKRCDLLLTIPAGVFWGFKNPGLRCSLLF